MKCTEEGKLLARAAWV